MAGVSGVGSNGKTNPFRIATLDRNSTLGEAPKLLTSFCQRFLGSYVDYPNLPDALRVQGSAKRLWPGFVNAADKW